MADESIKVEADELNASTDGDMDLDALERDMEETEKESMKLRQIQSEIENQMNLSTTSATSAPGGIPIMTPEEKAELDSRSVYVGNVDYGCTAEELEKHFHGCGSVSRVTILCDKFTGHPKGFAYVEFTDVEGMKNALAMDESLLRGRQIKVNAKRTNKPGISTTNRPPRFRGVRGMRGGMRGAMYNPYAGFRPRGRGIRRRPNFHPYAI